MAKVTSIYICQQCGFQSSSFLGRCPQCDNWNTFVETLSENTPSNISKKIKSGQIIYTSSVEQKDFSRIGSGLGEFDRVLGGGIVKGSVVLVSGDPGIGKSTLLTQLALNIGGAKKDKLTPFCLYVAGEESAQQIKLRAERIKKGADIAILNEVDVDVINATIQEFKPALVIIDSIQTLITTDLVSAAGSVSQVRECATRLQRQAKQLHIPFFIVGHVTKEGVVAGPRTLEHLVDAVLTLEGDQNNQFRILRGIKNRFGPTDEVGIFDMREEGMREVQDPSSLFLETKQAAPGSSVVPILTGLRPILVEIQGLVTKSNLPIPRRASAGVDNNRLQLLTAVLQKRLGLPLFDKDIFVNVTGGLKIIEPAADLGICMAIISSFKDQTIPVNTAFIGEVGLLGELRNISGLDKRVNEAKKLGYKNIYSPEKTKSLVEITKQLFK